MRKSALGCNVDIPDRRDKLFLSAPESFPSTWDLRGGVVPEIQDQGSLGSCTAHGISRALRIMLQKEGLPDYVPSRLMLYYGEREIENTVLSDSGAMIRDGLKFVQKTGVADELLWPYNIKLFTQMPTMEAYDEARTEHHHDIEYLRIDNSMQGIKAAIFAGSSVIIGFSVYSSFFDTSEDGIMPAVAGSLEGGHCVTVDGWDDRVGRAVCSNSWSSGWGDKGYFYMPYDFLTDPDSVSDLWVIQKV